MKRNTVSVQSWVLIVSIFSLSLFYGEQVLLGQFCGSQFKWKMRSFYGLHFVQSCGSEWTKTEIMFSIFRYCVSKDKYTLVYGLNRWTCAKHVSKFEFNSNLLPYKIWL